MTEYMRENRIAEALSIRGWKQIELAEKTGIPKNSINAWVKQKWQPRQKPLMKMAKALDVSEMWLAGYDVPMERPEAQKRSDSTTDFIMRVKGNKDLEELLIEMSHLTDDQLKTIKSMVTELNKLNTLH